MAEELPTNASPVSDATCCKFVAARLAQPPTQQLSIHPRHPGSEMVVRSRHSRDGFLHRPNQGLPVKHQVMDLMAVQRQCLGNHARTFGGVSLGGSSVNQRVQRGVGKPAVVVFAFAGAGLKRMHQRVHGGLGISFCPAPAH